MVTATLYIKNIKIQEGKNPTLKNYKPQISMGTV